MTYQEARRVQKRLFESQTIARAVRDFLASSLQVFFQRFCIACQLRSKLFYLSSKLTRSCLASTSTVLARTKPVAFSINERFGRARCLVQSTRCRSCSLCLVSGILAIASDLLRASKLQFCGFFFLGESGGFAQSARFLLR